MKGNVFPVKMIQFQIFSLITIYKPDTPIIIYTKGSIASVNSFVWLFEDLWVLSVGRLLIDFNFL